MARNAHRITNKSNYNADSVIAYCNRSLVDVNDDFLIPFDAVKNDDANFFGTYRDNLTLFRQSDFIVRLLEGSTLTGVPATRLTAYNRDPRMKHLLTCSQDTAMLDLGVNGGNGGFRGVAPATGDPNASATTGINATKKNSCGYGLIVFIQATLRQMFSIHYINVTSLLTNAYFH